MRAFYHLRAHSSKSVCLRDRVALKEAISRTRKGRPSQPPFPTGFSFASSAGHHEGDRKQFVASRSSLAATREILNAPSTAEVLWVPRTAVLLVGSSVFLRPSELSASNHYGTSASHQSASSRFFRTHP